MKAARLLERLKAAVKDAPDFPRPGILFKDIMPVFQDPVLVADTCAALVEEIGTIGKPDVVVGIEARGFLIGPIMAQQMNIPFVAIRKKGKLPRECFSVKYEKVSPRSKTFCFLLFGVIVQLSMELPHISTTGIRG